MDILPIIEKAISSKEKLMIVYLGGSRPGVVREIAPLSLDNGKVRARCYLSNTVKTFMIKKIQIMDSDGVLTEANYQQDEVFPFFNSYSEVYDLLVNRLVDLGWYIELSNDSISLHRKFKNGKLRKSSEISIYYDEYVYDEYVVWGSGSNEIPEAKKRKKMNPYMFSARNEQTCGFKSLEKSVRKFVKYAELLAPNE